MNQLLQDYQDHFWSTPDSYFGFNPVGDLCICIQTRDSDCLTQSNYRQILKDLKTLSDKHEAIKNNNIESGKNTYVYDFRANHWACGWVEYILIRQDAPDEILQAGIDVINALSDYPVYDEEDYSDLETETLDEAWNNLSLVDKMELCQKANVSIFASRHDYLPSDDQGYIRDTLLY